MPDRRRHVPDLAHLRCADRRGKTTAHTDTYHGHFVQLVPNERVVEVRRIRDGRPALRGEMTITITLVDAEGGADLVAEQEGRRPVCRSPTTRGGGACALAKLAALVEAERDGS